MYSIAVSHYSIMIIFILLLMVSKITYKTYQARNVLDEINRMHKEIYEMLEAIKRHYKEFDRLLRKEGKRREYFKTVIRYKNAVVYIRLTRKKISFKAYMYSNTTEALRNLLFCYLIAYQYVKKVYNMFIGNKIEEIEKELEKLEEEFNQKYRGYYDFLEDVYFSRFHFVY